ncbi:MAG: MFS transporter [Verrucomicrobia bacterium]|nr:MFS transporter [Verrucomicrobiota bacterium]
MIGIWPVFKTLAGLDLASAGLLAASCVLIGEALQGLFGSLGDRGYHKYLLMVGVALTTSSAIFGHCSSYTAFFFLFLATCIGSAAFHPTASSILGQISSERGGSIMGFFTAAGMLGIGVSQMLFSWIYTAFDGSTAILAVPSLVLVLFVYLFLHVQPKREENSEHHGLFPFALFLQFLKIKILRLLYFIMVGNQIVIWTLAFLLPDFLLTRGYPSWIVYGGGHLFLMAGAAICPPIIGYLADRNSVRGVIATLSLGTTIFLYVLLASGIWHPAVLFPLLFALGGSLNSVSPLVWSLGNQLVPKNRGMVSAFLMGFVWLISESIGLGLGGVLASSFGEDGPAQALACMGVSLLLTFILARKLPKTIDKSLPLYLPTGDT